MSVQALGWVLDQSPTSGTDRLVLLAIANHASNAPCQGNGGLAWEAWPGVETIRREAGLARTNTVGESFARLEAAGALVRVLHGGGDRRTRPDRRPNLYRVLLAHARPVLDDDPPPDGDSSEATTPRLTDERPPASERHDPPPDGGGTVTEPSMEPSTCRTDFVGPPDEERDEAWTPSAIALAGGHLDEARRLCQEFAAHLVERGVRVPPTRPASKAWVGPMELLLRVDGRTPADVERVLVWLHRGGDRVSHFWQANVLSPDALRRQWDRMALQYRREAGPRPSASAAVTNAAGSGRSLAAILDDDDPPATLDRPTPLALEARP